MFTYFYHPWLIGFPDHLSKSWWLGNGLYYCFTHIISHGATSNCPSSPSHGVPWVSKKPPNGCVWKRGYIYNIYIYKWIRGHFNREDGWTCWRTIVGIAYFQTTPNGLIYPSIHVIWLELGSYISHEMFIDIGRSKMPFSDAFCYGYDTSSLKYPSYSQLPSGILI